MNPTGPRYISRAIACRALPTRWDGALALEAQIWRNINLNGGLQAVCPGHKYEQPPWVKMPPQGKRFSKIANLAYSPGIADGTDRVMPFNQGPFFIPDGFDGCIVSTVFQYTGTGFQEASGDLTWRIKINERYQKDYSAVTTQIGSLTTPYNINSGQILVQSGNLIEIIVNVSTGAAGNLAGGMILGALFGWTWPR